MRILPLLLTALWWLTAAGALFAETGTAGSDAIPTADRAQSVTVDPNPSSWTDTAATSVAPLLHTNPTDSLPHDRTLRIYTFPIREAIMPAVRHLTDKCFRQAQERNSDLILIQLNTYGGLADIADSLRTAILNCPIPVWVWIDNQAASAGALIALAADRIYIRPGGSIGAASVVDGNGKPMPDKYQSFMRAMMRSTAEAHGKRIVRTEHGDTLWQWYRDPAIAEAMVGRTHGDSTTVQVLTLTADEALQACFAEGKASGIDEVLTAGGIESYTLEEYRPSRLDRLLGWMMHPGVQGLFILMIIGGIYFELQSPGIGLPLGIALLGVVCYFAPLYLEGIAQHWELLLFLAGLVLIAVEIFVIPGFGVTGMAGIVCVILGLSFAAIDNDLLRYIPTGEVSWLKILRPLLVVIIASALGLILALWIGRRFLTGHSPWRQRIVLDTDLKPEEGCISRENPAELVGQEALVAAVLHPSGRVLFQNRYYEAVAEDGLFIDKGTRVRVVRVEGGILYCRAID